MNKIKLFCLPYAGGSAMIYSNWKKYLNRHVELQPVELAGRGLRFGAPLYNTLEDAVNDVYDSIKNELDSGRYAIFGHSLGSMLAYELAFKIKENRQPNPVHIFFSGRYPPHIKKESNNITHTLPDEEFKKVILDKGGTPNEIFENKQLLYIFMPILRADFKIVENYIYVPRDFKIGCSITTLSGREDDITKKDLEGWKGYTDRRCSICWFDGGHFFIHDHEEEIVKIINSTLLPEKHVFKK